MDPAVVSDYLARLEPALLVDRQCPVELLARRSDRRQADAQLGRVEVDLSRLARRAVRHRERRACRAEARERAGGDRVVDPESLAVEELQVRAELHAWDARRSRLPEVTREVLEV